MIRRRDLIKSGIIGVSALFGIDKLFGQEVYKELESEFSEEPLGTYSVHCFMDDSGFPCWNLKWVPDIEGERVLLKVK